MSIPVVVLFGGALGLSAFFTYLGFALCLHWMRATQRARMDAMRLGFTAPVILSFLTGEVAHQWGTAPNAPSWFHASLAIFSAAWLFPKRVFTIGPGGLSFGGTGKSNGQDDSESPDSSSPASDSPDSPIASTPASNESRPPKP